MRQGLIVAALFWLVQATYWSADYIGPYPTREVCEAARRGALEFGGTGADCVASEQYDDYLEWQKKFWESMGDGGHT